MNVYLSVETIIWCDNITTKKQSTTKRCVYFTGHAELWQTITNANETCFGTPACLTMSPTEMTIFHDLIMKKITIESVHIWDIFNKHIVPFTDDIAKQDYILDIWPWESKILGYANHESISLINQGQDSQPLFCQIQNGFGEDTKKVCTHKISM